MPKVIILTNKELEYMKQLISEGLSDLKIGKLMGYSETKISKERKKLGIEKIKELNDNEVIEYYKNTNLKQCAKYFHVHDNKIKKILEKNNIPLKTSRDFSKYKYNEFFFDNIDTEEKAYWLGFICADGYINDKNKRLVIELNRKDKEHLEKFRYSINGNHNIFDYEQKLGSSSRIVVTGNIYNSLSNLGLHSKKSYNLDLPIKHIPQDLIRHFIRGYFDGDGSIYYDKNKNCYAISFVGLKNVLEYFKEILKINNNIVYDKRTISTHNLVIKNSKEVKRVLDYMYKDSIIYLDRKYNLYVNI